MTDTTEYTREDGYVPWLVSQLAKFSDEELLREIQGDPAAAVDNYRRFAAYIESTTPPAPVDAEVEAQEGKALYALAADIPRPIHDAVSTLIFARRWVTPPRERYKDSLRVVIRHIASLTKCADIKTREAERFAEKYAEAIAESQRKDAVIETARDVCAVCSYRDCGECKFDAVHDALATLGGDGE